MKNQYDYIIVGSGFGGSVSALRLSEKGYKVLVIEKGKKYEKEDFPKSNWNLKRWIWLPSIRWFGIMKITIFRHISVLTGTGVGGGSLVYGNVLAVPKTPFYKTGSWKNLETWQTELSPYYEKALDMLGAAENPNLGPEILPGNEVINIVPLDSEKNNSGYEITYKSLSGIFRSKSSVTSRGVIFSGGVLKTAILKFAGIQMDQVFGDYHIYR